MNERINEEIGALLDGRLESGPRTELLARLAASDEDFDVFADTAAVLREAEEGESAENEPVAAVAAGEPERPADVIPLRPRRASVWQGPAVRWLAAAALLAGVALIPLLRSRTNPDGWREPSRLIAALAEPEAPLPAEWGHSWSVRRGAGDVASDSGVAAQVGALHVDLEVTVRASKPADTAAVAQLAREAAAKLESANLTTPGLAAREYQVIADSAQWAKPDVLKQLATAGSMAAEATDPDLFALGAWTEVARLAAEREDAAFFRSRESRTALEQAANLQDVGEEARQAVTRLRAVQDQGNVPDWTSLRNDLNTLQRELAR